MNKAEQSEYKDLAVGYLKEAKYLIDGDLGGMSMWRANKLIELAKSYSTLATGPVDLEPASYVPLVSVEDFQANQCEHKHSSEDELPDVLTNDVYFRVTDGDDNVVLAETGPADTFGADQCEIRVIPTSGGGRLVRLNNSQASYLALWLRRWAFNQENEK